MTERRTRRQDAKRSPGGDDRDTVAGLRAETEPEWADAIRRGRKDRAQRLRSVFASFDEEDPSAHGRADGTERGTEAET